jgi:hypothetical protein
MGISVNLDVAMSRRSPDPDLDRQPPRAERTRGAWAGRGRALALAFSVAAHAAILLLLLPAPKPPVSPPTFMVVSLIDDPRPIDLPAAVAPPDPTPAAAGAKLRAAEQPTPAKSVPRPALARPALARPTPARRDHDTLASTDSAASAGSSAELSEAQLAGAEVAGSGSGASGRPCDMAARLQASLRKDPLVQSAVAKFAGKAVRVWDGDWVWFEGDDGKGLTAVRQAMMWEIAFAPAACRAEPMHGLVVLSANGAQGGARLAVGVGQWRWSDLLTPHPGAGEVR